MILDIGQYEPENNNEGIYKVPRGQENATHLIIDVYDRYAWMSSGEQRPDHF